MTDSLRQLAVRGGGAVAARQLASLLIGLAGTIALTRLLGPAGYGRFAAAAALHAYLVQVMPLGLTLWLVRREQEGPDADAAAIDTVRTMMLGTALLLVLVGVGFAGVYERWVGRAGVGALFVWMVAALPVQAISAVGLAVLERRLAYPLVARIELEALVLFQSLAVLLAWRGLGPLGIVLAWWAQVAWSALRVHRAAGAPLRFAMARQHAREGLRYGLGVASTIWVWQLRELLNPLVVGRFAGVEGVGVVALATRIVEAAAFVKAAVWRLSLPTLARLQHDRDKLAVAVHEGMRAQLLLVGLSLGVTALVLPFALPILFGGGWATVTVVFPLLAAGVLANAAFNLHTAALYALGAIRPVLVFHLAFIALLWAGALLLVPLFGTSGVGLAEFIALPAYVLVWWAFRRRVPDAAGAGDYLWAAVTLLGIAGQAWSPWFAVCLVVPFAGRGPRASVGSVLTMARTVLARKVAAA